MNLFVKCGETFKLSYGYRASRQIDWRDESSPIIMIPARTALIALDDHCNDHTWSEDEVEILGPEWRVGKVLSPFGIFYVTYLAKDVVVVK